MTLVNWTIAIVSGVIGGFFSVANWFGLIRYIATGINYSQFMFVGGILLCICLYNTPLSEYWYIALLIDPGVWIGIYSLPSLIKQLLK